MRISEWATYYKLWVEEVQGQPGETVYKVKYLFSTRDGSWEPSDKPGSVPQWARDLFLFPTNHPQYNHDGGADHHLFGAVLSEAGGLNTLESIRYWTYADNANWTVQPVKQSGWANIPIFAHSETPGPWAWRPSLTAAKCDVVKGGGLPGGLHISWFAVWERVVMPAGPVDPPVDPPTTDPALRELALRIERVEKTLDRFVREWQGGK